MISLFPSFFLLGMWSLRRSIEADFDEFLVQSFTDETRIFQIQGEEMEEREFEGFDANSATLYCGNMDNRIIVQVIILSNFF